MRTWRAEGLWADKNDCHPYSGNLANNTFREAVLSGLPPGAQKGLKTVVGLCVRPKAEWMEHLGEENKSTNDEDLEETISEDADKERSGGVPAAQESQRRPGTPSHDVPSALVPNNRHKCLR